MGAWSLLDTRSMVKAWCRSIQIKRNQKSFVCKKMNSGYFVRVRSFAGSMLATMHSLKTWTRCSRMRSLFLEIVLAAVALSTVRNLSLRYKNQRHETKYVSAYVYFDEWPVRISSQNARGIGGAPAWTPFWWDAEAGAGTDGHERWAVVWAQVKQWRQALLLFYVF